MSCKITSMKELYSYLDPIIPINSSKWSSIFCQLWFNQTNLECSSHILGYVDPNAMILIFFVI